MSSEPIPTESVAEPTTVAETEGSAEVVEVKDVDDGGEKKVDDEGEKKKGGEDEHEKKREHDQHSRLLRPLLHVRERPEGMTEHPNAERDANFLSKAFLFFINPVLNMAGEKDDLMSVDDIDLPAGDDAAERSFERFTALWDEAMEHAKTQPPVKDKDGNETPATPNLNGILLKMTWVHILLCTVAGAFNAAGPFTSVFLMQYINDFVASSYTPNPDPLWHGGVMCAGFFVMNVVAAIGEAQMGRLAQHVGIQVDSSLKMMMVKKSMGLSGLASKKIGGSGALVQHFSTDVQTVAGAFPMVYGQGSMVLSTLGAFAYLFAILGWPGIVVLVILCIVVPINYNISTTFIEFFIKKMKAGDARTNKVIEVLNSIRVIKFYAWEKPYQAMIRKLREPELEQVYNLMGQLAKFFASFSLAAPTMQVALFATVIYAQGQDQLNIVRFFQSLTIIAILNMAMLMMPMIYSEYLQLIAAQSRLMVVFCGAERDSEAYKIHDGDDVALGDVVIEDAKFAWAPNLPPPMPDLPPGVELPPEVMAIFTAPPTPGKTLDDVNFKAQMGELVMVVGKVGSGKSSLINAIVSEMTVEKGRLNRKGSVAYVPQTAWILNATVRNNILVNLPYDPEYYMQCIEAVDMTPDLKILTNGDLTEVGEKGINLSGGQKQRLSLARALYQRADIYIFDDPLSALDAHVGRHVFDEAICGLVGDKTRILVTNQMSYVSFADRIYVTEDMKITEEKLPEGDLPPEPETDEEKAAEPPLTQLLRAWAATSSTSAASPGGETPGTMARKRNRTPMAHKKGEDAEGLGKEDKEDEGALHGAEERISGSVNSSTFFRYLGSFGGPCFWFLTLMLQVILVCCNVGSQLWMAWWQESKWPELHRNPDYGIEFFLGIYAAMLVFAALLMIAFQLIWRVGAVNAPRAIYDRMTGAVIRAPMAFFDTTPVGRIINRFTEDSQELDFSLPMVCNNTIALSFTIIGNAVSVCYAIPWCTPVIVIALITLMFIQPSVATVILKRLASSSSSPVFNLYQEVLNGSQSIRGMNIIDFCTARFRLYIDERNGCFFANMIAFEAIKVRVNLVMSLVATLIMLVVVLTRDQLEPTLVIFGINNAGSFAIMLGIVLMQRGQLLMALNAVERMIEYTALKPEPGGLKTVPDSWPSKGGIEFKNMSAKYREELPLVLKNVNFTIRGGEKVGVVGRTGSGKSSLLLSIFRIIPITPESVVEIDGVDTSTIPLETLRSRVAAIPQEPILFNGTVQDNLDPSESPDRDKLRRAITMCNLEDHLIALREKQQGAADAEAAAATAAAGGDGAGAGDQEMENKEGEKKEEATSPDGGKKEEATSPDGGKKEEATLPDGEKKEEAVANGEETKEQPASNEPVDTEEVKVEVKKEENTEETTVGEKKELEQKEGEDKKAAGGDASPQPEKEKLDLLDVKLAEGDLSVGQRQLLCLARAVSRSAKILVLDEATSSVDVHTDALIQKTIRTVFKDCTVITVAHRLNTIMDSDRIVVLDQGSVAEFGTPEALQMNEDSIFAGLVAEANEQADGTGMSPAAGK